MQKRKIECEKVSRWVAPHILELLHTYLNTIGFDLHIGKDNKGTQGLERYEFLGRSGHKIRTHHNVRSFGSVHGHHG